MCYILEDEEADVAKYYLTVRDGIGIEFYG